MTSVSATPTSASPLAAIRTLRPASARGGEPLVLRPAPAACLAVAPPPRAPSPALFEAEFLSQYAKDIAAAAPKDAYAYVYRNGEKVGELGNDGSASVSGAVPGMDWNSGPGQGPALAQWRADQLKKAGLTIVKAETALTADQWKPWTPPPLDTRAMEAYAKAAAAAWTADHKVDAAT
jgi:hypothetical protein